ncbi:hypothetical protein Nos7524_0903 [Nostoc sp. PCC 7524]|uniref:hypothetical protein n=1 Tax=Nostoc sp. (strain ATCC 29411 / PCC 7524) TaxID=28072 RepID=UPI00029ED570|nr:hypothetical protein [Nostoc sp. PCC 7524]AFY46802.1 hypothetical protein Nos7524_0903 [Nostoc sp. PCC 7524]
MAEILQNYVKCVEKLGRLLITLSQENRKAWQQALNLQPAQQHWAKITSRDA